jgi:hypothetical protein
MHSWNLVLVSRLNLGQDTVLVRTICSILKPVDDRSRTRGHIYKLVIWHKRYTVFGTVTCATFCYFSTCYAPSRPQLALWPCAVSMLDVGVVQ